MDLPAIEREVSERWARSAAQARPAVQAASGERWSYLAAPLTMTGSPSLPYLRERVTGDLYCRFRTMQGFRVSREMCVDCHGPGVELAVATALGLAGPSDIRAYGTEPFIARCRESALRHLTQLTAIAERMGCVTDPASLRLTMDPEAVESVWSCLRQAFDSGLLVKDYRVGRYCPRCQTQLAEHELRRPGVFRPVAGFTVTTRFRLGRLPPDAPPGLAGADLLVTTPSPWILVACGGVAVDPARTYVVARRAGHDDRVLLAEDHYAGLLGEGWHVAARFSGRELAGAKCHLPFGRQSASGAPSAPTGTVSADVAAASATWSGIAPLAPSYGAGGTPPSALGPAGSLRPPEADPARDLPPPSADPIGEDGCFDAGLPAIGGLFFADAGPALVADLSNRGLLFAAQASSRRLPHCCHCGTVLLSRAMSAWHLKVSGMATRFAAEAASIDWHPATAGSPGPAVPAGDWAVSRRRFWGVPLPIWECEKGHATCVGSLAELTELADRDPDGAELHGAELHGADPQGADPQGADPQGADPQGADPHGADPHGTDPHRPAIDLIRIRCRECGTAARRVPEVTDSCFDWGATVCGSADLPAGLAASSAISSRSWLYALLSVGIGIHGRSPVKAAIRFTDAPPAAGNPAGGQRGSLVAPWPLIERHGADALRWSFTASGSGRPATPESAQALARIATKTLLRYWHCVRFYVQRARAGTWSAPPPPAGRPTLDRWLLSELYSVVAEVTSALEAVRGDAALRRLDCFIAYLSCWYVRLCKHRLNPGSNGTDRSAVIATLHECLTVLTRLLAPVVPFLSDYAWALIRRPGEADSVHLAGWPEPAADLIDERLPEQLRLLRRIVRAGRSARALAGVAGRQPLAEARIAPDLFAALPPDLIEVLARELNVKSVVPGGLVLPEGVPPGGPVPPVGLDLGITAPLRLEGLARTATRAIQQARKRAGLSHSPGDPIALSWSTLDEEVARAMSEYGHYISRIAGAADYQRIPGPGVAPRDAIEHRCDQLALRFWLEIPGHPGHP